jgi:RNA recognition motif-containing protein
LNLLHFYLIRDNIHLNQIIMNLYVSNLMPHVTEADLNKLFSAFGQVTSCKVIMDKFTGISRNFGFVEMPQQAEASRAINELESKNSDGTFVTVKEARPRSDGRAF